MTSPILFYDLVPAPGGPFFSPAATIARLAFLTKGVPFEVKEITYGDLRRDWCGEEKPLGVENATVPFIRKPDGEYLMDSLAIVKWLDETYPDKTNLYLPEAPLPVDTKSDAYQKAVEDRSAWLEGVKATHNPRCFYVLFAPRIIQTLSKEDAIYFASDARMGEGGWAKVMQAAANTDKNLEDAREICKVMSEQLLGPEGFLSSPSTPGMKDFTFMSTYRLVRSVDPVNAKALVEGPMSAWVERMEKRFAPLGWNKVLERDPVE